MLRPGSTAVPSGELSLSHHVRRVRMKPTGIAPAALSSSFATDQNVAGKLPGACSAGRVTDVLTGRARM
jgi:hypothetical protein